MFNEYFNPPSSVVSPVLVAAAPRAVDIAGSLSSTTIDQDVPSSRTPVDATHYRDMIGSLMHLYVPVETRPYLSAVCYADGIRKATKKALQMRLRRIFRYLKGTINMGLWYLKDTGMSLTAYSDADHAGCQDTRRSTSGSAQFLGEKLVSWSSKKRSRVKRLIYCLSLGVVLDLWIAHHS
ncbi:hypothetical protein Tco_0507814 [Tanacetum coccineum]